MSFWNGFVHVNALSMKCVANFWLDQIVRAFPGFRDMSIVNGERMSFQPSSL
jgi:hypothetical protein